MSRKMRKHSNSGYLHIVARGINKMPIFHERCDFEIYLNYLKSYLLKYKINLIAYCLMSNHIHLLIFDQKKNVSNFVRDLHHKYSLYFNKKYNWVGHLFQERFHSEAIEDDAYLMAAYRYILQNPVAAKICKIDEYEWSSYNLFKNRDLISVDLVYQLFRDINEYKHYLEKINNSYYFEYEPHQKDLEWAAFVVKNRLRINDPEELANLSNTKRNSEIKIMKNNEISNSQISKLTNIPIEIIKKI